MTSKTPQFDKALDQYFALLKLDEKGGQERTCRFSGKQFYVRPEDVAFYKKVGVPLPTLSQNERMRRRLSYQNNYNLFRISCAHSGKTIIASYPKTTPFKVYEHKVWSSDKWDPMDYGRDYNPREGFFEQFWELQKAVPRPSLSLVDAKYSEYVNRSGHINNCYLAFDTSNSQDCYYVGTVEKSQNIFRSYYVLNSEVVYECKRVERCARVFFCEEASDCLDSYFLYDCKNCISCFGCTNLRNKKYYFFNEYLGKEKYEETLKSIHLGNRETLARYKKKFEETKKHAVRPALKNQNAQNSVGSLIVNSQNCYQCIVAYKAQNVAYSMGFIGYSDCYDMTGGIQGELSYEDFGTEHQYNVLFSSDTSNGRTIEYCDLCRNVEYCFGCVALRNKKFCILNKQYTEEDYWKLVDTIKTHMLNRGEYGEFFPPEFHPIPYTISVAQAFEGFGDIKNAKRFGYPTEQVPQEESSLKEQAIDSKILPTDIKDAKEDMLEKVLLDKNSGKYFRIIKPELAFYKEHNIALPEQSPLAWLASARKSLEPPIRFEIHKRTCAKCKREIETLYRKKEHKDSVYCEECYKQEVV